eukprot:1850262-Prymnesium_polylepis.1
MSSDPAPLSLSMSIMTPTCKWVFLATFTSDGAASSHRRPIAHVVFPAPGEPNRSSELQRSHTANVPRHAQVQTFAQVGPPPRRARAPSAARPPLRASTAEAASASQLSSEMRSAHSTPPGQAAPPLPP